MIRVLLCCVLLVWISPKAAGAATAKRIVFFHIDALSWDAPERLQLTHWLTLARAGTRVEQAVVLLPWHQTENGYRDLSLTSPPNPTTMAGTLFLDPWWKEHYIQHAFHGQRGTAHYANSTAYSSLNPGMNYVRLDRGNDADTVRAALALLRDEDVAFMRLVLQDSNNAASQKVAFGALRGEAWAGDIYAPGSPYPARVRNADRLLGLFVDGLKRLGKYDDTLLVLLSDGNARSGWHPIHDPDSARIPLAFAGPGVARGRVLDYADSIDIVPTALALLGLPPVNRDGGSGQVLTHVFASAEGVPVEHPRRLQVLNEQLLRYIRLRAWMELQAKAFPLLDVSLMQSENRLLRPDCLFWNLERMDQWREAGSLERMLQQNACALTFLEQRLLAAGAPPPPTTAP
ncbi:MAG: sulfatase-like hydrolase/transferase [Pseudomonas oryzihabitans]